MSAGESQAALFEKSAVPDGPQLRVARGGGGIAARLSAFRLVLAAPVTPIRYRAFDSGPDLGALRAPAAESRLESATSAAAEFVHLATAPVQPASGSHVHDSLVEAPVLTVPSAGELLIEPQVAPVSREVSMPDPVLPRALIAEPDLSPPAIRIPPPVRGLQPGKRAPATESHDAPRPLAVPAVPIGPLAVPPPANRPDYPSAPATSPLAGSGTEAIASIRTRVIESVLRELQSPASLPAASPAPAAKLPQAPVPETGVRSAPRAMGLTMERAPSPAVSRAALPRAPGAPLERLAQRPRVSARETVHIGSVQVQVRSVAPSAATVAAPAPVATRPASAPVPATFRNVWLSRRGRE